MAIRFAFKNGAVALSLYVSVFGHAAAIENGSGKYLTAAAGCLTCHTALEKEAIPFAGGHPLKTPFGIFYTPNITPDLKTGIGSWSEADFLRALKQGLRPDGSHYFPAFPYPSYARMTDEDALRIFGYLKTLEPVSLKNREHEVSAPFSWRWLQWGWKLLFFDPSPDNAPLKATAEVTRGEYLTNALGHCGECHTPRNFLGGPRNSVAFSGVEKGQPGGEVSNITPDKQTGIGDWTKGDIVSFLQTGLKPDYDDVQGSMEDVIRHGTSKLTPEDRAAIAAYLLALKPVQHKTSP